jgi:ACS family hexuronate transporter-like MFS transporter
MPSINLVLCKTGKMNNPISKLGNYRWKMVALLFFATTINYIDRQVIGILKPFIAKDLGWSETDYGFIITAFQIAYAIGLLATGCFLDKFGTRLGYLWAIFVWSIAGMAHAAARGVSSFMAARFFLGLGESANFPAAVKSVAEWFPVKERAFAIGLFNSGSTVGAILAPIIVSGITIALGWRVAFIVTGAVGFIWLIFWMLYYQHPSKQQRLTKDEFDYIHQDGGNTEHNYTSNGMMTWRQLFKYKQTIAICATRFISDWVWWFFLFWIPDFLTKTQGINIEELVLPLIVIYAVSSIGGIGGGWISSQFIKSGKSIDFARKITVLLSAILVLPVIVVSQTHDLWSVVFIIAIAAAGHQSWASNIFSIISDIYPKKTVGSIMGLSGFVGAIGGALSASFVGLILQTTNSYSPVFIIAPAMYILNWLIIKIFIPKIVPINYEKASINIVNFNLKNKLNS